VTHRREPARPPPKPVAVANLETAHFDCVYPTCGGICCMNGRPAVEAAEQATLRANLPKFLPHLRPAARRLIEKSGFLSDQEKDGLPTLKVSAGWCAFWKDGCVLHQVGASEGDRFKYKPWRCALFPITRDRRNGEWYVRQRGERGEAWDLFCLHPGESPKTADATLQSEVAHLQKLSSERRIPSAPRKPDHD
jgi:hypothetical protein